MRYVPRRGAINVVWLVPESVFAPIDAIVRYLNDNFIALLGHDCEQAIGADDMQWFNEAIDGRSRGGRAAAETQVHLYKATEYDQGRERADDIGRNPVPCALD